MTVQDYHMPKKTEYGGSTDIATIAGIVYEYERTVRFTRDDKEALAWYEQRLFQWSERLDRALLALVTGQHKGQ